MPVDAAPIPAASPSRLPPYRCRDAERSTARGTEHRLPGHAAARHLRRHRSSLSRYSRLWRVRNSRRPIRSQCSRILVEVVRRPPRPRSWRRRPPYRRRSVHRPRHPGRSVTGRSVTGVASPAASVTGHGTTGRSATAKASSVAAPRAAASQVAASRYVCTCRCARTRVPLGGIRPAPSQHRLRSSRLVPVVSNGRLSREAPRCARRSATDASSPTSGLLRAIDASELQDSGHVGT